MSFHILFTFRTQFTIIARQYREVLNKRIGRFVTYTDLSTGTSNFLNKLTINRNVRKTYGF